MYKENKEKEISEEICKRLVDCYIEWLEAKAEEKQKKEVIKNV